MFFVNQGPFLSNMFSEYSSQSGMDQVGSSMVLSDFLPSLAINNGFPFAIRIFRKLIDIMNKAVRTLLNIKHPDVLFSIGQNTGIGYLPPQ